MIYKYNDILAPGIFMYIPNNPETGEPLNFHHTDSEKKEVTDSMNRENNVEAISQFKEYLWDQKTTQP